MSDFKIPKVVGHQGCKAEGIPGNSLAAFKEAKRQGVKWVEIDVRITKDGHLVLAHGESLSSFTKDGRGAVRKMNLADIKKHKVHNGEDVLTIDEALTAIKGLGLNVNVEMKCRRPSLAFPTAFRTLEALKKHGFDDGKKAYVCSFSKKALYAAKFINPKVERSLLDYARTPGIVSSAKKLDCFSVGFFKQFITDGVIKKAHKNDVQVAAFTANKRDKAEDLWGRGVDCVITDKPYIMLDKMKTFYKAQMQKMSRLANKMHSRI